MDNNAFWAFFVVALIAGFAVGMFFSGPGITGFATTPVSVAIGETDDGLDYTTPGSCTDASGTYVDKCINAGTVGEYVFNEANGVCSMVAYSCILGGFYKCSNGACIHKTTAVGTTPIVGQKAAVEPQPDQMETPIGETPLSTIEIPTGTKFYGTLSTIVITEINTLKEQHNIVEGTNCGYGQYVMCCWGPGCESGCCWSLD